MRDAFIDELVTQAIHDERIVMMVGDLGYSVVEPFAERFPDRFFNAGVAEQNMLGMAAGLASEGCRVFVYSIANFPTFRCAEQLRNDIDYHGLSVTVVAVGGGMAYGNLGYSHHAVQDYGLIRLFPDMLICAPGDPQEVRSCLRLLSDVPRPAYLRLGKAGEASFHVAPPIIEAGRWLEIRSGDGTGRTLLCTGTRLADAIRYSESSPGFAGYAVHSLPAWGAREKAIQAAQLSRWSEVVTMEDHYVDGGFGSWLLEARALTDSSVRIYLDAITPARIHVPPKPDQE